VAVSVVNTVSQLVRAVRSGQSIRVEANRANSDAEPSELAVETLLADLALTRLGTLLQGAEPVTIITNPMTTVGSTHRTRSRTR